MPEVLSVPVVHRRRNSSSSLHDNGNAFFVPSFIHLCDCGVLLYVLRRYNEGAASFGNWVDGETVTVESMEPGVSVEELEAQQAEFEKYLSEEKPAKQQELFRVESSLLSLQSSQRNNGRPIQEVADEELAPATLNRKWETLCELQGDFDRKISQLKNQYNQYSFMVSNFDAKAEAVAQWIKDTLDGLQLVAAEVDDSTANGLSQKIAAHARYEAQVSERLRDGWRVSHCFF